MLVSTWVRHQLQDENFCTPCSKAAPNAFVVKRSHCSGPREFSPLPDAFSDFVDEETWNKMNKGFVANLDLIHATPGRKVQSFPSNDVTTDSSIKNYKEKLENLKVELALVTEERDAFKRSYIDQLSMNKQLMGELSKLQNEVLLIREIPHRMSESVTNCKTTYQDVLSTLQTFLANEKSATAKLLSTTMDVGKYLFSTLESHFSMAVGDHRTSIGHNSSIEDQCNILSKRLNGAISSLVLCDVTIVMDEFSEDLHSNRKNKDCSLREEIASWKKKMDDEVNTVKKRNHYLQKELDIRDQLLEASNSKCDSLEMQFQLLKEERNVLSEGVANTSQKLAQVSEQKVRALRDLNTEVRRRRALEEEIREFHVSFARRQKSLMAVHSDFKSLVDNFKAKNPITISRSPGF